MTFFFPFFPQIHVFPKDSPTCLPPVVAVKGIHLKEGLFSFKNYTAVQRKCFTRAGKQTKHLKELGPLKIFLNYLSCMCIASLSQHCLLAILPTQNKVKKKKSNPNFSSKKYLWTIQILKDTIETGASLVCDAATSPPRHHLWCRGHSPNNLFATANRILIHGHKEVHEQCVQRLQKETGHG